MLYRLVLNSLSYSFFVLFTILNMLLLWYYWFFSIWFAQRSLWHLKRKVQKLMISSRAFLKMNQHYCWYYSSVIIWQIDWYVCKFVLSLLWLVKTGSIEFILGHISTGLFVEPCPTKTYAQIWNLSNFKCYNLAHDLAKYQYWEIYVLFIDT